jgi:hypothetical protein
MCESIDCDTEGKASVMNAGYCVSSSWISRCSMASIARLEERNWQIARKRDGHVGVQEFVQEVVKRVLL